MQSLEKALHQPMPFTTGGQTITDRLTAAKHSLAGSQLGKTICKATTEELMAPKKKHCDYLLHCTNEPNVSIPSMANLLIERTQNPNWIVVYKALITIHNIMCYGNERFSQYLASCNTTFNLTNFMDKTNLQTGVMAAGYDMSIHVRRYGKYISEKIHTYRLCAFDFCKVKRGREDGLLRTMYTDKLLKAVPILQNQIDALLEFQVNSSELNNGVINCCFILLFRDLIRLFACYNDGVINLLEKFFDMNKKQCREALDMYKSFLLRLDRVSEFLRVAETVGIDRGEIPDLTRAPASLLEALEAHLYHLEGGKGPPPQTSSAQQMVNQQIYQQQESFNFNSGGFGGAPGGGIGTIDDQAKRKYLEEEKERLRQYEEQRRQQLQQQGGSSTNPFGSTSPSNPATSSAGGNPDLLSFFDSPAQQQPQQQGAVDPTNPFASGLFDSKPQQPAPDFFGSAGGANPFMGGAPSMTQNPFGGGGMPQPMQNYTNLSVYPQLSQGYGQNSGGFPPAQQPPQQFQPFQSQQPVGGNQQMLGIYDQTPFSGTDGSYTAPSLLRQNMDYSHQSSENKPSLPSTGPYSNSTPWQQTSSPPTNAPNGANLGGDVDNALSNLVGNLRISNNGQRNDHQPPAPMGQPQQQPFQPQAVGGGGYSMGQQQQPQWNAFPGYTNQGGYMQQQPQMPPAYGQQSYGASPPQQYGGGNPGQPPSHQVPPSSQQQGRDPFGGFS